MDPTSPEVQAELNRRHKAAATTIVGLIVATILLSVVAYLSRPYLYEQDNPPLLMAIKLIVLVLGLGSVIWRRTKLASMRLFDIVGLAGSTGLLKTLEKTTLQMGLFGAAIALLGFIATLSMGSEVYTYWSGIIALVVFAFSYPRKSFWQKVLAWFSDPENRPATA